MNRISIKLSLPVLQRKIKSESTSFSSSGPMIKKGTATSKLIIVNLYVIMKINQLQETILVKNQNYQLSTEVEGCTLYQEHFHPHVLSKSELRKILGIITSGNFSAYIIKVNNGSILPPDDWSWVENFNLMRLYKAGITRVAYVSPQNIFSNLEMEKELKPGKIFQIRIFKKMNDALLWLEKTSILT